MGADAVADVGVVEADEADVLSDSKSVLSGKAVCVLCIEVVAEKKGRLFPNPLLIRAEKRKYIVFDVSGDAD